MTGTHPPGEKNKTNMFLAAHTIILAHAQAYNMYDKEFRAEQKGRYDTSTINLEVNRNKLGWGCACLIGYKQISLKLSL